MNLEYFFNLIQLFCVLLGLIGVFIIFKVQSLDTRINGCRNNIVTSIAQHEAVKDDYSEEEPNKKPRDKSVAHNFLIYNASSDDSLLKNLNYMIGELEIEQTPPDRKNQKNGEILYLKSVRDKWNNLRKKRTKIISSIKDPIIISTAIILYGLSISTYYSFESINNISDISSTPLSIIVFIVLAFLSIIYISRYIYHAVSDF